MSSSSMASHRARRVGILTVILVVMAISQFSAAGMAQETAPEDLFTGVTTLISPFAAKPAITVDGKISPGEYDPSVTYTTPDTQVSISLFHDNASLFVAIEGPSWSWVAFGISSTEAVTIGFVVIAKTGAGYEVHENEVVDVSDAMDLGAAKGQSAVEDFKITATADHTVAELRLSLESHLWILEPGVVFPTVVATNLTAPEGFPTALSGDQVHFLGSYLLRQEDNVRNVNDLLNGKTSPVPSTVALAILVVGIGAILFEFVVRRRKP